MKVWILYLDIWILIFLIYKSLYIVIYTYTLTLESIHLQIIFKLKIILYFENKNLQMSFQSLIESESNTSSSHSSKVSISSISQIDSIKSPDNFQQLFISKFKSSNYLLGLTHTYFPRGIIRRINLYPYSQGKSLERPIHKSLPHYFDNQYQRLFTYQISSHYFATYSIENHSTMLSLFCLSNKGIKRISRMPLGSYVVNTFDNALVFLKNNQFKCLFLAGDGTLRLIDLLKK